MQIIQMYDMHQFTEVHSVRLGHLEKYHEDDKEAGTEVHCRLVGDQCAYVVAEHTTNADEQSEDDGVGRRADDAENQADNLSHQYGRSKCLRASTPHSSRASWQTTPVAEVGQHRLFVWLQMQYRLGKAGRH